MRFVKALLTIVLAVSLLIPGSLVLPRPNTASAAPASARVDFNGDGFADLAIGVPRDVVSGARAGAVNILYGTVGGLSATSSQLWSQNSAGIPDAAEASDLFGSALATGDFNADGFTDLAVGVPGESVGTAARAGAVHVVFGSADGLVVDGTQFFSEKTTDMPERQEADDMFGAALATGDFNADGFDDLAIGVPGESKGTILGAGMVIVLHGSASGLTVTGNQLWHQSVNGVLNDAEANDRFGSSLAAADFNGDGFADLAVGVPLEDLSGSDAGGVNVLYGGAGGLSATNDQFWSQAANGIVDNAEAGDQFGAAVAAGDFNGDGIGDLAIGVRESLGTLTSAGAVHVLYGTSNGLSATGAQFWTQNVSGVPDSAEAQDQFGAALTAGDFNGDAMDDLVIAATGEGLGSVAGAGAVHVLYGAATRLGTAGTQFWSQDSGGILDAAEPNDRFGWSVASGDFDGDGFDDLVTGVPLENLNGLDDAGAANVVNGGTDGLTSTGNRFWNQATSGVPGDLARLDQFGAALAGRR